MSMLMMGQVRWAVSVDYEIDLCESHLVNLDESGFIGCVGMKACLEWAKGVGRDWIGDSKQTGGQN